MGRSILLYDGKEFLVGQFNILQNYQCNNEAKNCLGEDIEDSDGICLLMNEFKSKETEEFLIKIAIHSNHTKGGLGTKIVSNFKLLNDFYEGIEKIILRNADSDAEFKIIKEKTTSDIILSETKPLSLNPKVALGNRILILGEKGGKMFKIALYSDVPLSSVSLRPKFLFYVEIYSNLTYNLLSHILANFNKYCDNNRLDRIKCL